LFIAVLFKLLVMIGETLFQSLNNPKIPLPTPLYEHFLKKLTFLRIAQENDAIDEEEMTVLRL